LVGFDAFFAISILFLPNTITLQKYKHFSKLYTIVN
jgi:hypothetical protein